MQPKGKKKYQFSSEVQNSINFHKRGLVLTGQEMIALSLWYDKKMKSHFWWQGRRDPVPLSPLHYQNWPLPPSLLPPYQQYLTGKPWMLMATLTHPCSRLHLTDGLEWLRAAAPHCLESSWLPPHLSPLSPAEQQRPSSVFQLLISLSKKTGIKAAVSQEDSQVCLPLTGGGHTQWKTKGTENS